MKSEFVFNGWMPKSHRRWFATACLSCVSFLAIAPSTGCVDNEEIREYTAPKGDSIASVAAPPASAADAVPATMLAAVIPTGDSAWVFKLTASPERAQALQADFRSIVQSFSRQADAEPTWKLPEGWQQQTGADSFTYAKLLPPDGEGIKATVSPIAMPGSGTSIEESTWNSYIAQNVNRWRGQLSLEPESPDNVLSHAEKLDALALDKLSAYFVALNGTMPSGGPMMGGPMSGGPMARGPMMIGPAPGATSSGGPAAEASRGASKPTGEFEFKLPEGWTELQQPLSIMAVKSFETSEKDGKKAFVTFTQAGGDPESNVARWQNQVQPKAPPEQVADAIKNALTVQANSVSGKIYFVRNSEPGDHEAICCAILPLQAQQSLFVKLYGPEAAVEANREAFKQFVESLKW
ncbi:MAG: hypothetical protein U0892_06040 [Pirellulales bacterium]